MLKTLKEIRSLNRHQWGNTITGVIVALFVDAVLLLTGMLISGGEGGTPTFYWVGAGILGTVMTIALIGFGLWGSLDRRRMDERRAARPPTLTCRIPVATR